MHKVSAARDSVVISLIKPLLGAFVLTHASYQVRGRKEIRENRIYLFGEVEGACEETRTVNQQQLRPVIFYFFIFSRFLLLKRPTYYYRNPPG